MEILSCNFDWSLSMTGELGFEHVNDIKLS